MAAASTNSIRKIALVIGNGEYTDGPALPNAIKDAKDVAAALKRIGFINHEPKLNLNYRDMRVCFTDFECLVEENDLVLFYFAGHGIQLENQNYLIPSDDHRIDQNKLYKHAINAQHFLNSINSREPYATIFILDCCRRYHHSRNNELDKPVRSTNLNKLDQPTEISGDESLILFSCSDGTVADEGNPNENSLFTKHLLKHIETPNERVMDVLMEIVAGVKRESKLQQVPKIYTSLTHRHIYLAPSKQELSVENRMHVIRSLDEPPKRQNQQTHAKDDINILLLGETGIGKSTFINALANYLAYNSLEKAIEGELQAVIPASFSIMDRNTFDSIDIKVGIPTETERVDGYGYSGTNECRSHVFQIGNKNLRFIDTPGASSVQGPLQDEKYSKQIFAYVSQFEHLNAICILLRADQIRMDVSLRLIIKDLLRHLHVNSQQNIIFIFTNSRSTYYKPGSTKKLLQTLLSDIKNESNKEIPFIMENSFMLDNEAFRYLATRKNLVSLNIDDLNDASRSWEFSIQEISRLMKRIMSCEMFSTQNIISLYTAQQLVTNLSKRIDETMVSIQKNTKQRARIVCTNKNCTRISVCMQEAIEETVGHESLKQCIIFDKSSGLCKTCGCSWKQHTYIRYEMDKSVVNCNVKSNQDKFHIVEQHIKDLEDEQEELMIVFTQLTLFLYENSLCPVNDDILEYIQLIIKGELLRKNEGAQNEKFIAALVELYDQYKLETDLMKQALKRNKTLGNVSSSQMNKMKLKEVIELVEQLYKLPINGRKIREQMHDLINMQQQKLNQIHDQIINLPQTSSSCSLFQELKTILQKQ